MERRGKYSIIVVYLSSVISIIMYKLMRIYSFSIFRPPQTKQHTFFIDIR